MLMSNIPICSICYEPYTPSSLINTTTCGHIFHLDCILQWLEVSLSCPDCRRRNPGIFPAHLNFDNNVEADSIKNALSNRDAEERIGELIKKLRLKEEEQRKTKNELEILKKRLKEQFKLIQDLLT